MNVLGMIARLRDELQVPEILLSSLFLVPAYYLLLLVFFGGCHTMNWCITATYWYGVWINKNIIEKMINSSKIVKYDSVALIFRVLLLNVS